jgi:hypothetical protein
MRLPLQNPKPLQSDTSVVGERTPAKPDFRGDENVIHHYGEGTRQNGRREARAPVQRSELARSRESVFTRSPGRRGTSPGATTSHAIPHSERWRYKATREALLDGIQAPPRALPPATAPSLGAGRCGPCAKRECASEHGAVPTLNGLRPTSPIFAPTHPGPQERRDRDSHQKQSEDQQRDTRAVSVAVAPQEQRNAAKRKQARRNRDAPCDGPLASGQHPPSFNLPTLQGARHLANTHRSTS